MRDRAQVEMLVNGSYEYWLYYVRDERGQWWQYASGNGPFVDWADPDPNS